MTTPLYGALQVTLLTLGVSTCAVYTLPPASALIITAEMARLSMKIHAYYREKVVNGIRKYDDVANFIP